MKRIEDRMDSVQGESRRAFLRAGVAVGGGLLLDFSLPRAVSARTDFPSSESTLNAFVQISNVGSPGTELEFAL